MVFSSYNFIFFFLPITLIVFCFLLKLKAAKLSKIWLVLASLYFYAQGSRDFLVFFLLIIVFNYLIGMAIIKKSESKKDWIALLLLWIGLIQNIGLLCYYKYTDFLVNNVNRLLGTDFILKNVLLPIGISFFTFQLIAYLVDCYRGNVKANSFLDYLFFVTFFPKLLVGPIVHHEEIAEQLEDKSTFKFNPQNLILGIFIFSIGCSKKVLIADPLIYYAQTYYSHLNVAGFFDSWAAVLSYTFAYYFDFSGYGDMAIGLGLFFNIKLPVNFNSPYKARNFAEFWRRWNITVTQFLNDHIFKSIYGFGDRTFKLFTAVMITFIVSGIWHGSGWHFVIWGIVNGIFVCLSFAMTLRSKKLPFLLAWGLTFIGVLMTRVLFDSQNMTQALQVLSNMISPIKDISLFLKTGSQFATTNMMTILLIIISAAISFGAKNTQEITENFRPNWKYAAFSAVLLTLALFRMSTVSNFLYFRF